MSVRPLIAIGVIAATAAGSIILWDQSTPIPEPAVVSLPIPPFPPRIASGDVYEHCLMMLQNDPESAQTIANSWAAQGGGDGAAHCQALASIATGHPDVGATQLEELAKTSLAPDPARATVLAQAAQARLMSGHTERAVVDATEALALAPADTELMIRRAVASEAAGRWDDAISDLSQALTKDPSRPDALVLRAAAWRQTGKLREAIADSDRTIALDPDNPEALLERGIERQNLGDRKGARADWQRARTLDPNSTTADLAEQNLALLEAGPDQR